MKLKLNVDSKGYQQKPTGDFGAIRNRLYQASRTMEITPEELISFVEQGRSFTPAVMEQTTKDGWRSQQLLAVDIDNSTGEKDADGNKLPIPEPMTPEEALEIAGGYGLQPYFMYYTFSNKEGFPRYRMIFVLDRPLTGAATAEELGERLNAIFYTVRPGTADKGGGQIDRLFAGSCPGSVFYQEGHISAVDDVKKLPAVVTPEPPRREYTPPAWTPGGKLEELERRTEEAIENFDFAGYVQQTQPGKFVKRGKVLYLNPCPMCGHKDCLRINDKYYFCYSTSHDENDQKTGGIINFIMGTKGLDYGAARDYFKFEILRQDPEEWKQAYREEMAMQEAQEEQATHQEQPAQEQPQAQTQRFLERIQGDVYKPHETGLMFFDNLLGGGILRETLGIIVAGPGMGKTTLCQQVAEALAKNGTEVVYLNFEMTADQMLAKTISARLSRKDRLRVTMMDVLRGYAWTEEQKAAITEELTLYEKEIAPKLKYNPARVKPDIEALADYFTRLGEQAKKENRPAPAIIVDYLHLITSDRERDVQALLKRAVILLKEYAMKNHTFVIAIAATSRGKNALDLSSARDSSNIEYMADYHITMNYYDIDKGLLDKTDPLYEEKKKAMQSEAWRRLILRLEKNRFGQALVEQEVYFHAPQNTFYSAYEWMPADRNRTPFPGQERKKPQKKQEKTKRI